MGDPGGRRTAEEIQAEIAALESRLEVLREELGAAAPARGPAAEGDSGEPRRLRVLIADDEPDIRELVGTLVVTQQDMELVGVASDTGGAIEQARQHAPDVAVLDLSMPGGGGVQAAMEILRELPDTKIVAFTAHDTPDAQLDMMRAGAVSFLLKGTPNAEILSTIRKAGDY